jgi:hypothetical protein
VLVVLSTFFLSAHLSPSSSSSSSPLFFSLQGRTALFFAVTLSNTDLIRMLIVAGADVNTKNRMV